ncbi:hypothetical protein BGZ73_004621 [Actinomortierella ambigua]|nr:hypothetical protein BGZ73_004621 [Actinomortierella ambigua]
MHHQGHDEDTNTTRHRAQQLINLLASTGFPNAAGIDAIAIEEHLQAALHQPPPQGKAIEQFLDWILNNTSAATNWPGYERRDMQETLQLADYGNDRDYDDDQGSVADLDQEYENLQIQHDQLQHTLDSLNEELEQLQLQESKSADAARTISMQTNDLSVRMDTTLATLEETAFRAFHDSATWQDSATAGPVANSPMISAQHLYQCHEQIAKIQMLDEQFLAEMERMINDRLDSDPFRDVRVAFEQYGESGLQSADKMGAANPAAEITTDGPTSIFHLLLASDQAMDQEMVELCKLYRYTKMNHLRTVATLKGLEKQVQVLQEVNNQLTEAVAHQKQEQQNPSSHHSSASTGSSLTDSLTGKTAQTTAGAKVAALQQMRQSEVALISAQREASRLMEELDQTLSAPLPPSSHVGGGSTSSLRGSTGYENDNVLGELGDIGSNMTELYDRIARGDIELRFLEARYQDYVRSQKAHLAELDKAIDSLLDLYGCNQAVALMLSHEQTSIQHGKDMLGSLNTYLARIPAVSGTSSTALPSTARGQSAAVADQLHQRTMDGLAEDRQAYQRRTELTLQTSELARDIHANVFSLSLVQEALDRRLLHRHSPTNQCTHAALASKQLNEAQQVLGTRTEELRELLDRATRTIGEQIKK